MLFFDRWEFLQLNCRSVVYDGTLSAQKKFDQYFMLAMFN